jgi:hypothetical protein
VGLASPVCATSRGWATTSRIGLEGYELDEIQDADSRIRPDDPDLLRAMETLGLVLGGGAKVEDRAAGAVGSVQS